MSSTISRAVSPAVASSSSGSAHSASSSAPALEPLMGVAWRLLPFQDNADVDAVARELLPFFTYEPNTVLSIISTIDRHHYGTVDRPVEWVNSDITLIMTFPPSSPEVRASITSQLRNLREWALHADFHITEMPWQPTNGLLLHSEPLQHYVQPHLAAPHCYQLGAASSAACPADHIMVCNRVWYSSDQGCYLVTESYRDLAIRLDGSHPTSSVFAATDRIMRHAYPCHGWTLPPARGEIVLGCDAQGVARGINILYADRMSIIHPRNDDQRWHPLLIDLCHYTVQSGLRTYVATRDPGPWLQLRRALPPGALTFVEDAVERPCGRNVLLWDYLEPPRPSVMRNYSNVGTVVWTRPSNMDDCLITFPSYILECQWPRGPLSMLPGILHRRGEKTVLYPIAR